MLYCARYQDRNGNTIEVKSEQSLEEYVSFVHDEVCQGTDVELWINDRAQEKTELQKFEDLAIANSEYIIERELESALSELGV